jgi:hypothetical protein
MFLEFANEQEFQAYLGEECLQPRPGLGQPTMDPNTGQMVPPPPRPSIYEAMLSTDLVGERLECRFDPTSRQQNAMRIKTLQDVLAQVATVRDGAGIPYLDLREILKQICRESNVEASDYKPSEGEIAVAVAARLSNRGLGGGGGEDEDKSPGDKEDHSDSRKANGQRGTPAVPGRQTRDRGPFAEANDSGVMNRRSTARA